MTYQFKADEILLFILLYNTQNGLYRGIKKTLSYITLRGDVDESFYFYDHDEQKSKILYSTYKLPLPNIFQSTAFKNHVDYLINERSQEFSKVLMFFHWTLDRTEEINQYFEFYSFMKEVARFSNQNLVRNSNVLLITGGKIDPEFKFLWVKDNYPKVQERFKVRY